MRRIRLPVLVATTIFGALSACELVIDTSRLDEGSDAGDAASRDRTSPTDARFDASSDAFSDAPAEGAEADAACPGEAGPAMVRVGGFCIDSTEVTSSQYAAFLTARPIDAKLVPVACAWKHESFSEAGTGINGPDGPVGSVDWCDAYVYCKWAGKRLCGDPKGGPAPYGDTANPAHDAWFSACSHAGMKTYPYGDTFAEDACNGLLADGGFPDGASMYKVLPVRSKPGCVGGYPGIFDMSGNAAEWEDSCDTSPGGDAAAQLCHYRGGSANSTSAELTCAAPFGFATPYKREGRTDDLGFRCCSP